MERVILARHGESDYSLDGRLNGDPSVACGLTSAGLAQARRLGAALAGVELDLCLTSAFERTRLTACEALRGRQIPSDVVAGFNDPVYGRYEGAGIEEYRTWAASAPSDEPAPGGGESRRQLVRRYACAYRDLLGRTEAAVLLVAHSLPISYVLAALRGQPPRPRAALVEYATPHPLERDSLAGAVAVLEAWLDAPDW
jgi:broad specificity phosphatase PhoE